VTTWNATYPFVRRKPSAAIREVQWRAAFENDRGSWCCFVVEAPDGGLRGFAKAACTGQTESTGELSKIYLLEDYQRLGLGRSLLEHVVERFLEMGVGSMILFSDAGNPSGAFFEALGAERLLDDTGMFRGGYAWRDLRAFRRAGGLASGDVSCSGP